MPRKSSASAEVLQRFLPGERPPPPPELSGEAASEWTMIVDCLPATHLSRDMYPLLVALCRDTVYARELASWLDRNSLETADFGPRQQVLSALLALQKTIASLSVKLRLTPQSRYLPKYGTESKATRERDAAIRRGRRPWELPARIADDDVDEPGTFS